MLILALVSATLVSSGAASYKIQFDLRITTALLHKVVPVVA
jgi:hypothetical protein